MGKQLQNLTIKFLLVTSIAIGYVMLCSSCNIKKKFLDKNCRQDTVYQTIHDTIKVSLPQDTGKFVLQIEDLKNKIALLEGDSSNPEPPSRTIYEDSLIKVNARLNRKTKQLEWNLVHKNPIIKEVPIKVEVKTPCNCPEPNLTFNEWFDKQGIFIQLGFIIIFISALLFVAQVILSWLNKRASS